ncbi:hypothetical protein STSP_71820 [Streptomyces jeddahensis]|uniref:Uncharacterized protein n=1 Tax=Streptomyces jeddahensis TaxID=1716141 RepID=A0A177HHB6_9ACTN|nr:hypothetical protein STSP_71820 [Streptomyces jeddahensis]
MTALARWRLPCARPRFRLGRTVNKHGQQDVDQLSLITGAVPRGAREIGAEGRLGGHAKAQALSGSWRDVIENVNIMAARLARLTA